MSLVYLGSLSLGQVIPGLGVALASAVPRINAELAVQNATVAQLQVVPPTITGALSAANSIVAGINAAIALGVQVPSLSVQVNAALALIAALNIELGALAFDMSAPGIHAYAYAGDSQGLGPALPSSFPGGAPTTPCNALVLATTIGSTWVSLGAALKTS